MKARYWPCFWVKLGMAGMIDIRREIRSTARERKERGYECTVPGGAERGRAGRAARAHRRGQGGRAQGEARADPLGGGRGPGRRSDRRGCGRGHVDGLPHQATAGGRRSEERRGGKECRSRWS